MKALITGASTGLGKDFAKILSNKGYDLVLVARSKEKLYKLKEELSTNVEIEVMDLSETKNVLKLVEKYKNEIDLLINNAGFGECGYFNEINLDTELNMIDLNIKSLHILTKEILSEFIKKDKGQILNVASSAAFQPGPLMATYYATKSYVYNLTMAIYEELRRKKSKVKISVLCPGPVNTEFNKRAKVSFSLKGLESEDVVSYTIKCLENNKLVIIPGLIMKISSFLNRLVPKKIILKVVYKIQRKKLYIKSKS